MNVASLDLCKELYELSGWDDLDHGYIAHTDNGFKWTNAFDEYALGTIPKYDLGYLLRKLPMFLTIDRYDCRLEVSPGGYGRKYKTPNYVPKKPHHAFWCAMYSDVAGVIPELVSSDSPEDALCKLAIELIKQGLLTVPGQGGEKEGES